MGRPKAESLTPREAQIMDILWEQGQATAEEIREALPGDAHDSSVRTKLRVLKEKGYVRYEMRGRAYVYEATVKRANVERKVVRSMLGRFFAGSGENLLLRLVEDKHVTPEQLAKLQAKLEQQRSKKDRKGRES